MFIIQEIASALIAGVIVVVVDGKRLLGAKSWKVLLFLKSQVCSKLGLGAKPATPKNVRHSATAAPQNQLHLQIASPKNLHGGLRCEKRGTLRIPTPLLRYRTATPQKNQL